MGRVGDWAGALKGLRMSDDKKFLFLKVTDSHKRTVYINFALVRTATLQPSQRGQGTVLELKFDDHEALVISDPAEVARVTNAIVARSL